MATVRCGALALFIVGVSTVSFGQQPPLHAAGPLASAFLEYRNLLDNAERRIQGSQFFDTSVNRAEGYRYLMGLINHYNSLHMFFNDPEHPRFYRTGGTPEKNQLFSNADNLYLAATIADDKIYVVSGILGTARQVTFGSYAGTGETSPATPGYGTPGKERAGSRLEGKDIRTDGRGYFELTIGGTPPAGKAPHLSNFLPMEKGARTFVIYQIFSDWERENKGVLDIRCRSCEGTPAKLQNPESVARRVIAAGTAIDRVLDAWLTYSDQLWQMPVNVMGVPIKPQITSLGSWFDSGHYKLKPEEALVITARVPHDARYWGWTPYNPWSETLDYLTRQTSLNDSQAAIDADGMLRVVISERDPGVQNWLDISGHPEGIVTWRVLAESALEPVMTRVVPVAALKRYLPKSTNFVSPQQRAAILGRREAAVAARYAE